MMLYHDLVFSRVDHQWASGVTTASALAAFTADADVGVMNPWAEDSGAISVTDDG